MKNLLYSFFFLSLSFIMANCSPSPNNTTDPEAPTIDATVEMANNAYPLSVKDTISLSTYLAWKNNWANHGRTWVDTAWQDTAILTAFTLPLLDLKEVVPESGAATARFYLGLKNTKEGFKAKMMVVAVDSMNQDMTDYTKGQYVYDVSQACPPYCTQ